ncbi:MAG: F420-0--gamma-glutamyl ligase [Acidimicrobiia bacterium]|nr:MAG: F420-0--gamma-glutamyl ligase [Acidimicrobiia bacterium]
MGELRIFPVEGIGEVRQGDDVAALIGDAVETSPYGLEDGDVVVVTHKIVSKAEGRVVPIADEAAYRRLVENESQAILRRRRDLVIAETPHGFICANAGVDRSNVAAGWAVLLPIDPDRSANRIRRRLMRRFGVDVAVMVTDTFGRPWRRGLVDVAIGVAGMEPVADLRGQVDDHGRRLEVTEVALADEIAAAADLVMGKANRVPAAVVRGVAWTPADTGVRPLIRPPDEDLFR